MVTHRIPLVGFERGYFLDINCFFPKRDLTGHKILSGPCNMRCYYCHRKNFLDRKQPMVSIDRVMEKLRSLESYNTIVVTGGEITLYHDAAIGIMKQLREDGILTLFSTNGTFPRRVEQMVPFSDVVKIDIKGHKSQYKHITGKDTYDLAGESIAIASERTNIEVKVIIHSFTKPKHINQILRDVNDWTGMPSNLAVEFQPVRDFLTSGVVEPDIRQVMRFCAEARPSPRIVLLKHYGEKERIYRLEDGAWQVYKEKEIPLRFKWKDGNEK